MDLLAFGTATLDNYVAQDYAGAAVHRDCVHTGFNRTIHLITINFHSDAYL